MAITLAYNFILILVAFPIHVNKWSWRGLNPRPNRDVLCFLHAYPSLRFSSADKTWATNPHLILMNFTHHARPLWAISDLAVPLCLDASEQQLQSDISSQHLVPR